MAGFSRALKALSSQIVRACLGHDVAILGVQYTGAAWRSFLYTSSHHPWHSRRILLVGVRPNALTAAVSASTARGSVEHQGNPLSASAWRTPTRGRRLRPSSYQHCCCASRQAISSETNATSAAIISILLLCKHAVYMGRPAVVVEKTHHFYTTFSF